MLDQFKEDFPALERLDPNLIPLVEAQIAASGGEITVEGLRSLFSQSMPPAPHFEVAGVEALDIPGPQGALRVRIYRPQAAGPLPVIVHYHGGGFVIGDLDTHDGQCRNLCLQSHCIVASVTYRRAPEHKLPAAHEDAYAALLWLAENAATFGGDPSRIGVAGDSAGGNLAGHVAIRAKREKGPTLKAQLLVVPATRAPEDARGGMAKLDNPSFPMALYDWFAAQMADDPAALSGPWLNLMGEPSKALEGLPPAIIAVAEVDIMQPQGLDYADKLGAAGVTVDLYKATGMVHAFFSLPHMFSSAKRHCDILARAMGELMRA